MVYAVKACWQPLVQIRVAFMNDPNQYLMLIGGQAGSDYLDDVQKILVRTDNNDDSHVASHTPFKFRCLQQTFYPHAIKTLALVEDEN